ncbi:hypothetical protein GQX74_004512 [Glossina fuscipes]|nr:hypothetical protein GQX74_004512 [Glossina fuscipes]
MKAKALTTNVAQAYMAASGHTDIFLINSFGAIYSRIYITRNQRNNSSGLNAIGGAGSCGGGGGGGVQADSNGTLSNATATTTSSTTSIPNRNMQIPVYICLIEK